jgi:hypoxanthine phosphoribosyltransferase
MAGIEPQPSVLLSAEQIARRVQELSRQISRDYAAAGELVMVGVLRGCYIFLADLSRALTIRRRIDFIAVSAYGPKVSPSESLRLIMDVRSDLAGQHVLIVDDILDSGLTLHYLTQLLRARKPASLRTCVLLRKPGRLLIDIFPDYFGFDIPDAWVVGYGLDCADQYRALPYIGKVDPEQL